MRFVPIVFACALSCASLPLAANDYKVGDHLVKPGTAPGADAKYKPTDWDALVPKGWDPMKDFKDANFGLMQDGDPRAQEFLIKLQDVWEKAPVEPSLDGARVRIAGFIVPLESAKGKVSEFLLVPYFGACIHVPPPPANQIIHVTPDKPLEGSRMMDAVWVNGVLHTIRSTNRAGMGMASAGYTMSAQSIEPYKEEPRKK